MKIRDADSRTVKNRAVYVALGVERAFLVGLDGSCETPIAGLAELGGGTQRLRREILRTGGSEVLTDDRTAPIEDGAALAAEMARAQGAGGRRLLRLGRRLTFEIGGACLLLGCRIGCGMLFSD